MAVTSTRTDTIAFTGDVTGEEIASAAINVSSPGQLQVITLSSGANTITVPNSGVQAVACVIIPPATNIVAITLKGVTGDTGIRIHNTDPTVIAIDSSVTTFCLTAASTIAGLRLKWA